ncbi:MAG: hypothetical protein JWM89_959, partial [Acidimicrobiales bacterium]|nr:hypothetical protein [Acidimicrobiales bacterium]
MRAPGSVAGGPAASEGGIVGIGRGGTESVRPPGYGGVMGSQVQDRGLAAALDQLNAGLDVLAAV